MSNNDSPILEALLNGTPVADGSDFNDDASLMVRYNNKIVEAQEEWQSRYMTWKSNWGAGEWNDEPDIMGWVDKATGYLCLIRRSEVTGSLCGYIGVTRDNKAYGLSMDECPFNCHGNVTYAGHTQFADFEAPEDFWWIGFDCGHYRDLAPAMDMSPPGMPFAVVESHPIQYRNVRYVKAEVTELAEQIYKFNQEKLLNG